MTENFPSPSPWEPYIFIVGKKYSDTTKRLFTMKLSARTLIYASAFALALPTLHEVLNNEKRTLGGGANISPDQHGSIDDRSLDWSFAPESDATMIEYAGKGPAQDADVVWNRRGAQAAGGIEDNGNDWFRRSSETLEVEESWGPTMPSRLLSILDAWK